MHKPVMEGVLREAADPETGRGLEPGQGAVRHVQCCLGLWKMTVERALNLSGKETIGIVGQSLGSKNQMAMGWGGRRR